MSAAKPLKNKLSQIFASLNLITAAIEARICIECNWDDDDLEYFCRHTDEIPEAQKQQINNIITSELTKRLVAAPAIPTATPSISIANIPAIPMAASSIPTANIPVIPATTPQLT